MEQKKNQILNKTQIIKPGKGKIKKDEIKVQTERVSSLPTDPTSRLTHSGLNEIVRSNLLMGKISQSSSNRGKKVGFNLKE